MDFPHEMFDHPAVPGNADREHDYTVDQYECVACHDGAHAQYEQDVNEVVEGTVDRTHTVFLFDHEGAHTDIPIDSPHWGPTRFLTKWHERNGYCPLH